MNSDISDYDYAIKEDEIIDLIHRLDNRRELTDEDRTKIALLLGELSGLRKSYLKIGDDKYGITHKR